MRLQPWLRGHPFDAFIVALAAFQVVEAWVADVPGPSAAVSVAALAWTLPLLWRRRLPFAAPAAAFAASIAAAFLYPTAFGAEVSGLVALMATFWVVGAHNERRQALAGAAIGLAALAVVEQKDIRMGPEDAVFWGLVGGAVTLIAFTLSARSARAAELERREAELVRERDEQVRAAIAAERARIGRDLHAVIARSLGVMTAAAGAARASLDTDPAAARTPILAVEENGRQALADLRRLLGLLHESADVATLAPRPGIDDLGALLERARVAGLPVVLTIEGRPAALPPGVDLAAFRIVQEALTNALEHDAGATARVVVRYGPDALAIEISDDGAGRHGGGDEARLAGMRERVALYGGELQTERRGDGDFAVLARLPIGAGPP
jgi:signal transduction histidine kinase